MMLRMRLRRSRPHGLSRSVPCVLLLTLLAARGAIAAQPEVPVPQRPVLGEDGFLRVGDEPFFPLGIYHDSLDVDYYGDKLLADFETLIGTGFNCVALSMDFTRNDQKTGKNTAVRLAERAEAAGVYLMTHVYLPELELFVREQARWPGIFALSLGDDFNTDEDGRFNGPPKFPPALLGELDRQTKRVLQSRVPGGPAAGTDPLTYSSGLAHPRALLAGYGDTVDVLGIQCYPFGDGNQSWRNELEATQDLLTSATNRIRPARSAVWANLQAFAWKPDSQPSAAEMRAQAWLAILSRVRGIFWYSYLSYADKQPLPEAHPELWGELVRLVPEIRTITPFLVNGQFIAMPNPADQAFDNGEGTWHAAGWRHPQGTLLVVVNASRSSALDLTLPLPDGAAGMPLRPFDADRYPQSLHVANGRLRGQLSPGSVEVMLWPAASEELP